MSERSKYWSGLRGVESPRCASKSFDCTKQHEFETSAYLGAPRGPNFLGPAREQLIWMHEIACFCNSSIPCLFSTLWRSRSAPMWGADFASADYSRRYSSTIGDAHSGCSLTWSAASCEQIFDGKSTGILPILTEYKFVWTWADSQGGALLAASENLREIPLEFCPK